MGWTLRIITNCFSVCVCLLCVCMCICVHMLLCEGESRDWHWASSSIAFYLILLRQIALLNQELANLSRFDYPTSLWDPHVTASQLWYPSTGHHTWLSFFFFFPGLVFVCELWELGLGIGLGSSRLLVQSSLCWLSCHLSPIIEKFSDYSISTH